MIGTLNKTVTKHRLTIIYFVISLIPILFWYSHGDIYGRGDVLPFWISEESYFSDISIWKTDQLGFISNRATLFPVWIISFLLKSLFNSPTGLTQMILYSIYIFLKLQYFTKFIKIFFKRSFKFYNEFVLFAGAMVYSFNIFVLERNFYPTVHWSLVAFPMCGYYLIKLIESKYSLKESCKFIFVFAISIPLLLINPPLVIMLITFLAALFIFYFKISFRIILLSIISLLSTIWAIWLNAEYIFLSGQSINAETNVTNWQWTHANSNLFNILFFKVSWAFNGNYYNFVDYFDRAIILFILVLVPVFALFSFRLKDRRVLFLWLTLLIFIFLAKGLNDPFISVNTLFYKLPGSYLFREPRKFIDVVSLLLAMLFTVGLYEVSKINIKLKAVSYSLMVVLIGVLLFPFIYKPYVMTGVNINGIKSDTQFPIPDYLIRLNQDLNDSGVRESDNILLLPFTKNYQVKHNSGFWGTDELEARYLDYNLLKTPSGYLVQKEFQSKIWSLYEDICNKTKLEHTSVNYVVNRKYIDKYEEIVVPYDKTLLDSCDSLKLITSNDDYDLYKVVTVNNLFSISDKLYVYDTKDLNDDASLFSLIESESKVLTVASEQYNNQINNVGYINKLFTKSDTVNGFEDTFTVPSNLEEFQFKYSNLHKSLLIENTGDEVVANIIDTGNLKINDKPFTYNESSEETVQWSIDPGDSIFTSKDGGKIEEVPASGTSSFLYDFERIELYKSNNINLLVNGSFEEGFWRPAVQDCNNDDPFGNVAMDLVTDSYDGVQALQLSTFNHLACTSRFMDISQQKGKKLRVSFAAKSSSAKRASYAIVGQGFIQRRDFDLTSNDWEIFSEVIEVPAVAPNQVNVFLYAYKDFDQPAIILYDNLVVSEYEPLGELDAESFITTGELFSEDLLNEGYNSIRIDFGTNPSVLDNGDFEKGLWTKRVSDCHRYDDNPIINMEYVTEGGNSYTLLSAQRHNACTSTLFNIGKEGSYALSFDVQGSKSSFYGYAITAPNGEIIRTLKQQPTKNFEWITHTDILELSQIGEYRIHIYSYQSDMEENNEISYDNIVISAIPDLRDNYSIVSTISKTEDPSRKYSLYYTDGNDLLYDLEIENVNSKFIVVMNQSYNKNWKLSPDFGLRGFSTHPGVEHISVNQGMNGWIIDPVIFCKNSTNCILNEDGTYNMNVEILFTSQYYFMVVSLISGLTILLTIIVYITLLLKDNFVKNRNAKDIHL